MACFFLRVYFPVRSTFPVRAVARTKLRTDLPARVPFDGQEHHHHLEFENSYVRVFFVEIPAHDSTLFHRHDLPYLSASPTGADAAMPPPPRPLGQETGLPTVGYSPGNFSHAVSNSRDFPLRNVAIELLRPQGNVRNRCAQAVRDQPKENCNILKPNATAPTRATSVRNRRDCGRGLAPPPTM